jgi:hypothetical protein
MVKFVINSGDFGTSNIELASATLDLIIAGDVVVTTMTADPASPIAGTVGEAVELDVEIVYPDGLDAYYLQDYKTDNLIEIAEAIGTPITAVVTYNDTPVGSIEIAGDVTSAYLSELLDVPRALLSAHNNRTDTWGLTLSALPEGTHNITLKAVINTDDSWGTDDIVTSELPLELNIAAAEE